MHVSVFRSLCLCLVLNAGAQQICIVVLCVLLRHPVVFIYGMSSIYKHTRTGSCIISNTFRLTTEDRAKSNQNQHPKLLCSANPRHSIPLIHFAFASIIFLECCLFCFNCLDVYCDILPVIISMLDDGVCFLIINVCGDLYLHVFGTQFVYLMCVVSCI